MGRPVGSRSKDRGYIEIKILGRRILAHRAAWAYVYGELPDQIDHRDLDTSNNRLTNLRPATTSLNAANRRGRNRFGIKGVDLALRNKLRPYRAQIKVSGRSLHLGYYATPGEAGAAYLSAAEKHFGEFARGGAN